MSAVIHQLHLLQVQSLQNLLTGPVHDVQFFMAVHQDQCASVDPLQRHRQGRTSHRLWQQSKANTRKLQGPPLTSPKASATSIYIQGGAVLRRGVLPLCTYTQIDDVTAEMELPLLDDVDCS